MVLFLPFFPFFSSHKTSHSLLFPPPLRPSYSPRCTSHVYAHAHTHDDPSLPQIITKQAQQQQQQQQPQPQSQAVEQTTRTTTIRNHVNLKKTSLMVRGRGDGRREWTDERTEEKNAWHPGDDSINDSFLSRMWMSSSFHSNPFRGYLFVFRFFFHSASWSFLLVFDHPSALRNDLMKHSAFNRAFRVPSTGFVLSPVLSVTRKQTRTTLFSFRTYDV